MDLLQQISTSYQNQMDEQFPAIRITTGAEVSTQNSIASICEEIPADVLVFARIELIFLLVVAMVLAEKPHGYLGKVSKDVSFPLGTPCGCRHPQFLLKEPNS